MFRYTTLTLIAILLMVLGSTLAQAQTSSNAGTATPFTLPYQFSIIAQSGMDADDGMVMGSFQRGDIALNDSGQVAYIANVKAKNEIFGFKGMLYRVDASGKRTLIARTFADKAGRDAILSMRQPVLDHQGRVAYLAQYPGSHGTEGIAINNTCVLPPLTRIKEVANKAFVPVTLYFNKKDQLVVIGICLDNEADLKTPNRPFAAVRSSFAVTGSLVVLVNGKYSASETEQWRSNPENTQWLPQLQVDKNGRAIAVFNKFFAGGLNPIGIKLLKQGKNYYYPFLSADYAMNDNEDLVVIELNLPALTITSANKLLTEQEMNAIKLRSEEAKVRSKFYRTGNIEWTHPLIDLFGFRAEKTSGGQPVTIPGLSIQDRAKVGQEGAANYAPQYHKYGNLTINAQKQIAFRVSYEKWDVVTRRDIRHQAIILGTLVNSLTLTKATTLDAESVTINYTINTIKKEDPITSVHLDVYRSATPVKDDSSVKIGEKNLEGNDLKQNDPKHNDHTITISDADLLSGTAKLIPDTAKEYVVVVAKCNNGFTSTTYFRKWMLGVVVHGYSIFARDWHKIGLNGVSLIPDFDIPDLQDYSLPGWQTRMAANLRTKNNYNDVISFDWTKTCASNEPDVAKLAGEKLSQDVSKQIISRQEQHVGDVVDLHLIGHNRGAVVISEALKDLCVHGPFAELSQAQPCKFGGGYVEITLLDPHPANSSLNANGVKDVDFGNIIPEGWVNKKVDDVIYDMLNDPLKWLLDSINQVSSSKKVKKLMKHLLSKIADKDDVIKYEFAILTTSLGISLFEQTANDPAVEIPDAVKNVDVWYQHNLCSQFRPALDMEFIFNFHGMVGSKALISRSNQPVHLVDLSVPSTATYTGISNLGYIQVPDLYETRVVDLGKLNHTPDKK